MCMHIISNDQETVKCRTTYKNTAFSIDAIVHTYDFTKTVCAFFPNSLPPAFSCIQARAPPPSFADGLVSTGGSVAGGGSEREAALISEVREWQQRWRDECRLREKLNTDFLSAQRQWERHAEELRLKHEQELSCFRQNVYLLDAKLNAKSVRTIPA